MALLSIVTVFVSVLVLTADSSAPTLGLQDHEVENPGIYRRCRFRQKYLPPTVFALETCHGCYTYMPKSHFVGGRKWWNATGPFENDILVDGYSVARLTDGTEESLADVSLPSTSPLLASFAHGGAEEMWRRCCEAARECCSKIGVKVENGPIVPLTGDFLGSSAGCPATWDGWQCWSSGGDPGELMYESCPGYIYFHTSGSGSGGGGKKKQDIMQLDTCGRYAEKHCNKSGAWQLDRRGRGEWTDYTKCRRVDAILTQEYVHVAFYVASALALAPALTIFFAYKVLRVPRIAIHKNLFASLLIHSIATIAFKAVVMLPYINRGGNAVDSVLQKNTIGCRILLMITKYFRLTNYTWMFCEGYYLHRLLVNTFEEERSIKIILTIGWGLPLLPCVTYAVFRALLDDDLCWALPAESDGWIEWIYMIPGLLCILANACFFVNIFRILVTKLRAPHANEPAHFRKAVRATVVLLPLFGLHWLLTLYRPQEDAHCQWKAAYKYFNIVLDGLQGLIVSVAFCYRNGEITSLLSKSLSMFRLRRSEPVARAALTVHSTAPLEGASRARTVLVRDKDGETSRDMLLLPPQQSPSINPNSA